MLYMSVLIFYDKNSSISLKQGKSVFKRVDRLICRLVHKQTEGRNQRHDRKPDPGLK